MNRSATLTAAASGIGTDITMLFAVSPGPIKTRATGGLKDLDLLLSDAAKRALIGELVDIDDVGMATAYLSTRHAKADYGQRRLC